MGAKLALTQRRYEVDRTNGLQCDLAISGLLLRLRVECYSGRVRESAEEDLACSTRDEMVRPSARWCRCRFERRHYMT
uniref:Uncharacterized protein n=1 Tax=Peronospora matthiolae TaxID=2874970 RepID=A0AAV1TQ85_9STRA